MKSRLARGTMIAVGLLAAVSVNTSASASIIQTVSGISSVGTPVTLRTELSISGDVLTLILSNISPATGAAPNDLLTSYYFDIIADGVRPTLTYVSATGDVWLVNMDAPDTLQAQGADLQAIMDGDNTWQFKEMLPTANPFVGFGVGTAGNATMAPNGFNGNIIDGMDYGIGIGDIATRNLDGKLIVKGPITFTFSGASGFAEADVSQTALFGLGTAPDSVVTPEPAAIVLLAIGAVGVVRRRRAM